MFSVDQVVLVLTLQAALIKGIQKITLESYGTPLTSICSKSTIETLEKGVKYLQS